MPPLVNQYADYPIDNPNGPILEPTAEKPKESKNISKYLYVAIGIVVVIIIAVIYFSLSGSQEIDETYNENPDENNDPGDNPINNNNQKNETTDPVIDLSKNGICDPQENCFDNSDVCKCKTNEYCSDKKECVSPKCGNLYCEDKGGESPETCCTDCKCTIPGQICSSETKACEEAKMALTQERAVELVRAYFEAQGVGLNSAEALGIFEYNQTFVQRVKIQKADEPFSRQYAVNENEEVIDLMSI